MLLRFCRFLHAELLICFQDRQLWFIFRFQSWSGLPSKTALTGVLTAGCRSDRSACFFILTSPWAGRYCALMDKTEVSCNIEN